MDKENQKMYPFIIKRGRILDRRSHMLIKEDISIGYVTLMYMKELLNISLHLLSLMDKYLTHMIEELEYHVLKFQ